MEEASGYRAPRGYVIPDEPSPGKLSAIAVTPFATLLGLMLGGAVVGLPWMVLNGYAIGSATRRREAAIAAGTAVGMLAAIGAIVLLVSSGIVPRGAAPYLGLVVHAIRLGGAYWIYLEQEPSFELYRYFGGRVARHGWVVAVALLVLRLVLVVWLGDSFVAATLLF